MPFNGKSGKFNASINTVEFGCGDKAVKIGGENVLPLYTFDAPIENAPKIGVMISDLGLENEPAGVPLSARSLKKQPRCRVQISYA